MNIDHFYQFAAGRRHFELPEHPFWRGSPNPSRKYPDFSVMGNKIFLKKQVLGPLSVP